MRIIVAALVLAAACGEVSPAGISLDGQAGSGGAGGDAGSSGSAGAGGGSAAGAGADALPPSCLIPLDQVNGTDPMATINRANGTAACQNRTLSVQIVGGMYYDASWEQTNYTTSTDARPGMCDVSLTYKRPSTNGCGVADMETLHVFLTVPAI